MTESTHELNGIGLRIEEARSCNNLNWSVQPRALVAVRTSAKPDSPPAHEISRRPALQNDAERAFSDPQALAHPLVHANEVDRGLRVGALMTLAWPEDPVVTVRSLVRDVRGCARW